MKINQEEKRKPTKNQIFFLCVFFLFSVVCIVFSILCISKISHAFFVKYNVLLSIATAGLLLALCGFCVWCTLRGKETLTKTLFSGYILLTFCLVLAFILQKTGFFSVIKSAESLQKYLEDAGVWMPIFYIILQYLQVIILPIPSIVSTAAGVGLFGPFYTLIYSLIGIILGSITAFFVGRKLGHKTVAWIVGEDVLNKWQNKLKGKDNLFLTLMFVLPMFPDDVLCFLAGLSSMSTRYFLIMILISRILAVSCTAYSVDFIPLNTWWGAMLWVLFFIGFFIIFTLLYKNLDKIQAFLSKRFKTFGKKQK